MINMHVWSTVCAAVVSAGLLAPNASNAQWGTIKGQVVVTEKVVTLPLPLLVKRGDTSTKDATVCAAEDIPDESLLVDPESNGIANVVVWLVKKPSKVHPDLAKSKHEEVVFDQKGCRFVPHVLLVRTDQQVRILSDDAIIHNTHTFTVRNKQENSMLSPRDRKGILLPKQSLEEKLPQRVMCDIHPWMTAWWVILDHPYAAVTNTKGEFEIANLPAGEHEFRVWQEKAGYLEKTYKVTVKAGDNNLAPIKVSASSFNK